MRTPLGLALLGLLLCAPLPARAYVLIDGSARAGLDSWAFSLNSVDSSQLSFDGGLTDHVYEIYGYLGNANGVVRVTPANFAELVPIGGAGNMASSQLALNASGAAALGLAAGDITLDYGFELRDATRELLWDVRVGNQSLATQGLVFYAYFDLDLEGDFGNDLASGGNAGFQLADAATGFALAIEPATPASHFQIAAYPNVQVALDNLQASGAADLPDAATPFGPGDFTGALQFDLLVAAGGSQDVSFTLVPEPASALELALGLLGLGLAGRRRA